MTRSKPGALTANNVLEVTIDDTFPHGFTLIKLPNVDGTYPPQPIWYRVDGVDPVPGAEDTFVCVDAVFVPSPANGEGYTPTPEGERVKVRLVCTAAVNFTVEGNPVWKRV